MRKSWRDLAGDVQKQSAAWRAADAMPLTQQQTLKASSSSSKTRAAPYAVPLTPASMLEIPQPSASGHSTEDGAKPAENASPSRSVTPSVTISGRLNALRSKRSRTHSSMTAFCELVKSAVQAEVWDMLVLAYRNETACGTAVCLHIHLFWYKYCTCPQGNLLQACKVTACAYFRS